MSKGRILIVALLSAGPIVFLMAVGVYHLWDRGWMFTAWWPMALCWLAALLLAGYWQRRGTLLKPIPITVEPHWTDRDREAWNIVETEAARAVTLGPKELTEPHTYMQATERLALEIARFYHPKTTDPYGTLTVPEMLAVAELAAQDLTELVETYLPASHMMRINDWKAARSAIDIYRQGSNIYWMASALFAPWETAARYAASRFGLGLSIDKLQGSLLSWFYEAYIRKVGAYLIELHSGRLRVGAKRFRELMAAHRPPAAIDPTVDPSAPIVPPVEAVNPVTVTLIGQVKMGKSSLTNAILGSRKAVTDVLPATSEVARYRVAPRGIPAELVILDTVGYAHTGPREDQLQTTELAAQKSDVILLVLHARNPARQADVQLLDRLAAFFANRPDLKRPPVIAVLTHIDLLTPAMEWAPPYDWLEPKRMKDQSIRDALTATRDQLGDRVADVVPVCTAPGKVYGLEEALLPAIACVLEEARAVALLRVLRDETDTGQLKKVFQQVLAVGLRAAKILWEDANRIRRGQK